MRTIAAWMFVSALSAAVSRADEWGVREPQGRPGAAPKAGARIWASAELFGGLLEATDASGTDPDFDAASDFKSDIDAWLVQSTGWINGGYEFDFGLTVYGKLGFAFPTLVEDIDAASPIVGGTDVREDVVIDRMPVYGLGLGFRRVIGPSVVVLGRLEYTLGSGEVNNASYHTLFGDGDYEFSRLELKGAVGLLTDLVVPYLGVRYNMLTVKLDYTEIGGPDTFDVEYELDTPVGVFVGVTDRVGERIRWNVEIGVIDAFTFEVGVGLAF